MQMSHQEQKWLVLLYSLIELDGGSQRKTVLKHIQENGYWYKNDQNDICRTTRNEKVWRNDFSFERQHLVANGYMCNGEHGLWKITEAGKEYVQALSQRLQNISFGDSTYFTAMFYQKFFQTEIQPEFTADQLLLEQLLQAEDSQDEFLTVFSDKPMPKGLVSNRSGNKNIYLRDPAVARRALIRAGHRCEINTTHTSFLRKNSSHLYMEPHHLIPMSMTDYFGVSLDREQNIFSLCSNCHNQIHYGTKEDVQRLISELFLSREQEICSILGRHITLEEIYQIYKVA
ncbi:hypothetical protein D7X33_20925 [Butyricicoccus sp. 1XD8-22]|nr:hypothetical protein D7X33_20925 [Butyricicoccus sp. 1XD8-22]